MSNPRTVVVILEAKDNKETDLRHELEQVIKLSRQEASNIEYRLHQSEENPRQFILYENWQNKEGHLAQFDKPYIKIFLEKLDELIEKSYQAYFANEINVE